MFNRVGFDYFLSIFILKYNSVFYLGSKLLLY